MKLKPQALNVANYFFHTTKFFNRCCGTATHWTDPVVWSDNGDYVRWLSDDPDPHDLMRPFQAEPMRMWPISTRVNKPENEDPSIVEPVELSAATA